jgi:predicted RNA binding protein YcfA (HicA-like mRNA interferase family)
MALETNRRRIVRRLKQEGWVLVHGGRHDKFEHADRPGMMIVVPRHAEVSPGVARSIAKTAGWA